jgi:hypothetical protein
MILPGTARRGFESSARAVMVVRLRRRTAVVFMDGLERRRSKALAVIFVGW